MNQGGDESTDERGREFASNGVQQLSGDLDHVPEAGLAVVVGEVQVEALGQVEVALDGAVLPLAPEGVAHHEVELGPVECGFADFLGVIDAERLHGLNAHPRLF